MQSLVPAVNQARGGARAHAGRGRHGVLCAQVEYHPYWHEDALVAFCASNNITMNGARRSHACVPATVGDTRAQATHPWARRTSWRGRAAGLCPCWRSRRSPRLQRALGAPPLRCGASGPARLDELLVCLVWCDLGFEAPDTRPLASPCAEMQSNTL